jgi:endonuclease IV
MRIGVHVSIAGHIYESLDRAEALGCNTMQIFSRNPRGWSVSKLELADIKEFKKLKPVFVLATQENLQLLYSTKAVNDYLIFYTKNYNLNKELN